MEFKLKYEIDFNSKNFAAYYIIYVLVLYFLVLFNTSLYSFRFIQEHMEEYIFWNFILVGQQVPPK